MATATSNLVAGEREAARKTPRVSPLWQVLVVLIGLFVFAHNANWIWATWNGYPGRGDFGAIVDDPGSDGFARIASVTPGGPMAAIGARKGDAIRFDRGMDAARKFHIGETAGLTLRRNGALSHVTVAAVPRAARPRDWASVVAEQLVQWVWTMIGLIGLFVALRSRRQASTLLLGAALVCLGCQGDESTLTESAPWLYPAFYCLVASVFFAEPVLFLVFARVARRETSGRTPKAWTIVVYAYAAAQIVSAVYSVWLHLTMRPLADLGATATASIAAMDIGYLLAIVALGAAWRESRGQDRTRYAFMLVAIALLSCLQVMGLLINLTGNHWTLNNPLVLILIVCPVTGAGVFAYAVLRHRVLDIGFAVNRTLIYGVVSAILLAAFGLIEWAADHFVPIEGREKNALVDAAVALAVFLTFHRVRDGVEEVIERLFFRRWQKAEAELRRFVREAAFFGEGPALTRAFVKALSAYAEGAPAALYLAEGRGYARAFGDVAGAPDRLAYDLGALVSLRADPKPVEVGHDDGLNAALIAPMVNRNEVIGLALLGPKPSGASFRPDEIELVGWATRQIGLDLHALKVEQLEVAQARQAEQISTLRTEVATLRSVIPQRA